MNIFNIIVLSFCVINTVNCGNKIFRVDNTTIAIHNAFTNGSCPYSQPIQCPISKYSEIDGSCNNLANPYQGKHHTPLRRILPSNYQDGRGAPVNRSVLGGLLSPPRIISTSVLRDTETRLDPEWTNIFASWGQFIAHDVAEIAVVHDPLAFKPDMQRQNCPCEQPNLDRCFSFYNPANDVLGRCMNFARSSATHNLQCQSNVREQLNMVTSRLDLSQVYGSEKSVASRLRTLRGGQLITSQHSYLPFGVHQCDNTNNNANMKCFTHGGDERPANNLPLAAIQTAFLRVHNLVATELARINPQWHDLTLYHEARRIMIAAYQHIIYDQFLPGTIGVAGSNKYNLLPRTSGYFTGYNTKVDLAITNEFATAAWRYGHSTVNTNYERMHFDYRRIDSVSFTRTNYDSTLAFDTRYSGLEAFLYGSLQSQCARSDLSISAQLAANGLRDQPGGGLLDLAAYNIARGRDHGLPGYTRYLQRCTGQTVRTFDDLIRLMGRDNTNLLRLYYQHVDDIDLFVGGLAEQVVGAPDVMTGPTFTCIIGEQFRDLRNGDRFYYENAPLAQHNTVNSAFTVDQLNSIRTITASKILCLAFPRLKTVQPNIFFLEQSRAVRNNTRIPCSSLPDINLNLWRA